jgi:hypothetical protein
MSDVSDGNQPVLPLQQRQRGQKLIIRTAVSNCLLNELTKGNLGQVFLLSLGATPWHIGLQATLNRLAPLAQLPALKAIVRTGKSRLAAWGYLSVLLPLGCLVALAFGYGTIPPTLAILGGIAAYAAMAYTGSFANTSWWPLLQDVTAGEPKGAFFARMRTRMRSVELLVPMGLSWYIAKAHLPWRFVVPFALGIVTTLAAAYFMRQVPERLLTVRGNGLLFRMRLAMRVRSVRAYLRLVVQSFFTEGLIMPFFVVMIRARGLPDSYIVLMGAAAAVGHVIGLGLWARSVDTHGGRPALGLTLVGVAIQGLAWLAIPTVPSGATGLLAIWKLLVWAMGFYLLWGFFRGGFLMGRTQFLLDAIPHRFQADGFTLISLAEAAGGALGAFLGGLIFNWLTVHPVSLAGIDGRALYLAAVQLAMVAVWPAKKGLTGHAEQTPAREFLANAWQLLLRRPERP